MAASPAVYILNNHLISSVNKKKEMIVDFRRTRNKSDTTFVCTKKKAAKAAEHNGQ